MREVVLPMTLKEIEIIGQECMEKYCRYAIQKRYSEYIVPRIKTNTIKGRLKDSNLERYLKQLNPNAEETLVSFYSELVCTEPNLVELYETTVNNYLSQVVRKPRNNRG